MSVQDSSTQSLDGFDVTLRPLGTEDTEVLHELSISVQWPHRHRDIATLMEIGTGYLATDEINRVLSSGMRFSVAKNLVTIGMMITVPRLQAHGAGRWILERLIKECPCDSQLLYSTRKGFPLYQSAGFEKQRSVIQQQGIAHATSLPQEARAFRVRPLQNADLQSVHKLDTAAFGADRTHLLNVLFPSAAQIVVIENDGIIDGYAVMRPFGRGQILGPVVAGNGFMAIALIAPLIKQAEGRFLRMDAPAHDSMVSDYLVASGLGVFDTVFEMRRGKPIQTGIGANIFGLAFQATG